MRNHPTSSSPCVAYHLGQSKFYQFGALLHHPLPETKIHHQSLLSGSSILVTMLLELHVLVKSWSPNVLVVGRTHGNRRMLVPGGVVGERPLVPPPNLPNFLITQDQLV
mmetsp:Transcript_78453/g.159267  ORF Transcript_78453/g.159267 Transcript_78453/m.159267 type:complete len:109 (+) Transcript_78453:1166-1492(+)